MATLHVVFTTLVLQASWGLAFSSLLGPRTVPKVLDQQIKENKYCFSCIKIDNICYNHTYLLEFPAPFAEHYPVVKRMGTMNLTNVLYYTFEPKFSDEEYSKVAYVSLYYPEFYGVISGWHSHNFGPFDIDHKEKKVYLGGSDGIWVVDDTNYFPKYFMAKTNLITNVVVKDYLYFTAANRNGIFKYRDATLSFYLMDQKIHTFVLDDELNIVFVNDTGLFISFHNINQEEVKLSSERWFKGLTVDMKGTVYAWHAVNGINKVSVGNTPSETTLKRVTGIAPDAMTFDESNNILYSVKKKLYKLTKVATSKCFGR
ncbi:uncharacterized protein LOC125235922 [Leguminivora glycinivorella]|uniref:uncharacterized protein LOC125235922 n=1 Tax=Leguminivora glycinivorella TaxID=1035111 RepID=UPI00200E8449|nr:uncharacterized protein LOC125235922 [Leguminivora glycinivorella]